MSARSGDKGAACEVAGRDLVGSGHRLHDVTHGAEQGREQMSVPRRPAAPDFASHERIFLGPDAQRNRRQVVLATLRDGGLGRLDGLGETPVEFRRFKRQTHQTEAVVGDEKVVHPIERLHRSREEVAVTGPAVIRAHLLHGLAHRQRIVPLPPGERLLHGRAQATLEAAARLRLRHVVARTEDAGADEEQRERRGRAQTRTRAPGPGGHCGDSSPELERSERAHDKPG